MQIKLRLGRSDLGWFLCDETAMFYLHKDGKLNISTLAPKYIQLDLSKKTTKKHFTGYFNSKKKALETAEIHGYEVINENFDPTD